MKKFINMMYMKDVDGVVTSKQVRIKEPVAIIDEYNPIATLNRKMRRKLKKVINEKQLHEVVKSFKE